MRIRVPGRIIALGILLALLCALPTITSVAHARPIGWDGWGLEPEKPSNPNGDNDGGVLARSFARPAADNAMAGGTSVATGGTSVRFLTDARTVYLHAGVRGIFAMLRLDYWAPWPR